jgi:hypothetical protein
MPDLMLQATWIDPQQAGVSLNHTIVPWAKSMLAAGHRLAVEIRLAEDKKSDQQRKYYHGVVLKQIAQHARPGDQAFPLAVWKEHFRKEFLGFKTVTFVNPMTGKKSRRRVRVSTEDLGVKAYNLLIEKVTAYAATELGVAFDAPQWIDPDTGEILQ